MLDPDAASDALGEYFAAVPLASTPSHFLPHAPAHSPPHDPISPRAADAAATPTSLQRGAGGPRVRGTDGGVLALRPASREQVQVSAPAFPLQLLPLPEAPAAPADEGRAAAATVRNPSGVVRLDSVDDDDLAPRVVASQAPR